MNEQMNKHVFYFCGKNPSKGSDAYNFCILTLVILGQGLQKCRLLKEMFVAAYMMLGSPLPYLVAGFLAAVASEARPRRLPWACHLWMSGFARRYGVYRIPWGHTGVWTPLQAPIPVVLHIRGVWWPFLYLTHAQLGCLQIEDIILLPLWNRTNGMKTAFNRKCITYNYIFMGSKGVD